MIPDWLTPILKGIGDARVADILREKTSFLQIQRDDALRKLAEAERKIGVLESELKRIENKSEALRPGGSKGDKCPYCQQENGVLKDLKPHPQSLLRQTGHKVALYECSNCGRSYDRQVRH